MTDALTQRPDQTATGGDVLVSLDGGVLTVTLNRPSKRNALTDAMYATIAEALQRGQADTAVRVMLIRGEGEHFSGGNDIGDFTAIAMGMTPPEDMAVHRVLKGLADLDKPLVAAVRGVAVGIGTTMLLNSDLVFVAEDARLSTPFVNLALAPEAASSLLMPMRIGHVRAFSMFALGDAIDGRTAAAWGIANAALPAAEVDAAARKAAEALAQRPINALRATKRLMRDADALWTIMQRENAAFGAQLTTPEAREAFMAFAERRSPDFSKLG
jgi:enoyl-CoA hydratase/carnithine racemase